MGLALALAGWLLAAVLVVALAALFLPLVLEMRATADETVTVSFTLRPFGRMGPRIPLKRGRRKDKAKRKPAARKKTQKRSSFRADPKRSATAAMRFARDVLRVLKVRLVSLDLRFGCADPAETGELYGLMTPLIYGTYGWSKSDVRVEPVFDGALLKGHAAVSVSLVPVRLVPPVARFGWALFGPGR